MDGVDLDLRAPTNERGNESRWALPSLDKNLGETG